MEINAEYVLGVLFSLNPSFHNFHHSIIPMVSEANQLEPYLGINLNANHI